MSNQITPNPSVPSQVIAEVKFPQFINNLGIIPTSYKDSMSYYETLAWFCKYLEETVIPSVNQNGNAVQELQNLYIELNSYVAHYFDNLDVQEEIDNKLDEMTASGDLQRVISNYFNDLEADLNQQLSYFKIHVNNDLEEQNDIINNLQTEVNRKINSNPIPVASAGAMTDTSKIYVLTTDGYWYYYNGSSWTQGGIYQASQSTDEVEGIKNYLIDNNIKTLIEWEVGDLVNGAVSTNVYRIITPDILIFPFDLYLKSDSQTQTFIWTYTDSTGSSPTGLGWLQDEARSTVIPKNTYFRLVRDFNNNSDPDRVALSDAYDSVLYSRTYLYKYYDYQEIMTRYDFDSLNLKYNILLNPGDLSNGQLQIQNGTYRRLVTQFIQKFDFDVLIPKATSNVADACYLVTYSDSTGSSYQNVGWVNRTEDYIIDKNTYFRLVISLEDLTSTFPTEDMFTSDVFKQLRLYKSETTDVVDPTKKTNVNFKSVAHQGYTLNDTVGRSTKEATINAKLHGFDYSECDIKFSSDGVPVCCHDDTFDSNGNTIIISQHTVSELKTYDYYGGTIATLEELVEVCKILGMGLYIDQLPIYNETKYNTIFSIIDKYQMSENVKWLTSTGSTIDVILTKYPTASIVITSTNTDPVDEIALANAKKTDINHVSLDLDYFNISTSSILSIKQRLNAGIDIEVWTIDGKSTYLTFLPYVTAITSNKICYNDVYDSIVEGLTS